MSDLAERVEHRAHASTVDLLGGRLCLDYVNTVGWRGGKDADEQEEVLRTYADLVAWALHAGALANDEAARLLAEGVRHPDEAAATLVRAITLREALHRIFTAAMSGAPANLGDLEAFNAALVRTMAQARIVPKAGGYDWTWSSESDALDQMLRPVVRSAADLLTSAAELGRVRECAGAHCDWLFLDTSRNHSRRWCSMDDCGNRAKARRHYQRQRAGDAR